MHARQPLGKHHTILLAMPAWLGASRALVMGLAEYARRHGPWDFHYETHIRPLAEMLPRYKRIDGVVTQSPGPTDVNALRRRRLPTILLGGERSVGRLPLVTVDGVETGRVACRHLLDRGLKHLAISAAVDRYPGQLWHEGFADESAKSGIPCSVLPTQIHSDLIGSRRMVHFTQWLENLRKPLGLLAGALTDAREVVTVCHARGLMIPEEVAVLSVGEDPMISSLFCPELSTVDHGSWQAGYKAGEILDALLCGEQPSEPVTVIPPVGVKLRGSTDIYAIEEPFVVQALRFIRTHFDEPIKVRDVVHRAHVSRRTLEYAFKKHLGRTVHREITRQRVERVKELLATTSMATPDIAAASGFSYSSQMFHVFKRETGTTPNQYRSRFVR